MIFTIFFLIEHIHLSKIKEIIFKKYQLCISKNLFCNFSNSIFDVFQTFKSSKIFNRKYEKLNFLRI